MKPIRKIVVLGANGVMGSGSGAVFASAGIPTVFLARTLEKAEAGRVRAEQLAKGKVAPGMILIGTYDSDLAHAVAEADLIFEAVAEDLEIKKQVFALIDRVKSPGAIVATVSSGLSIAAMCTDLSEDFRKHFLGVHLFNPPTVIAGTEIIPHAGTDRRVVEEMRHVLEATFGRIVIECADTPAFAGNRIGFKLLNEVAQLAQEHGVAYMDQLVGTHTGRALPPLATIDLVGWDVHKAIVDNLYANTHDEAHAAFALPMYMQRGIDRGHLGRKTKDKGGFFRVDGKGPDAVHFVLDPVTGDYRPLAEAKPPIPSFIERMKAAIRSGSYPEAFDVLCRADGKDAAILRRVMLGYVSYALGRVGEVVAHARDVDRIMGFGFNWAPPSVLVDAIGAQRTIELLEREGLAVPPVLAQAAAAGTPMCDRTIEPARFFVAA
ncbi:MAG TPA: 3-hydroxyacyl-CoA dehydrogenase family protein [Kofleriaceae bacterium]|nr:3-hydroxyacyl-CoA dehydrogenase family protein [Kofleriaceae bacterium]